MIPDRLQQIAEQVVSKAQKAGAELSEAFLSQEAELTIEVSGQEIETLKKAEQTGLGLRVIRAGRMGFAYTTDLSAAALEEVVQRALENSDSAQPDEFNQLPGPVREYPRLDLFDPSIPETPVEKKIALAMEIEREARRYDPRVKITERCAYQDSVYTVCLANSLGLSSCYRGAFCGASAFIVAEEDGDSQTGFGLQYSLHFQDLDPAQVGREAAEKGVRMLGAREVKTQKAALVLDPYVATGFLGILAPALTAEAVQKGKSLFAGKVGEQVASPALTLIDDGTREGGIVSAPFDGEGVPTGKTVLIRDGRLEGFLYNTYTAAKEGVKSTGNATRRSFRSTPEVGTTNFYIQVGTVTREQLIKEVDKGLYVTEVMGLHTANPISGDFSLGAAGLWIEQGEFKGPVRGVVIAGNILELLRSVDGVADDLTFFISKGSPTLRVARITISGS
ncbi:TldD/PmbA family protein [Calderihabitans maritimus]|uniref:C69 family peptidase n=1 Tax=Calderihabitans maritimus TaxID=1246530 RepID=A0A1Z5HXA7_9FIRM|nr:TldD/PmbA family protein [Calderihabitans maritimus]GAW94144.1 C69 family peptidase [Calderihabitans maritimus]